MSFDAPQGAHPLKAIRELIGAAHPHPVFTGDAKPTERQLAYLGSVLANCPLCQLESALTAAEQELRERVERHLDAKQLIAVSFDSTTDASSPPKGRWIYLQTALDTLAKQIGQSDARVAAAFELAAQRLLDMAQFRRGFKPIDPDIVLSNAAQEVRALTPPEATAALEKMLLEARREEAQWWMEHRDDLNVDLVARLAALTGEKKAQVKP